MIISVVRDLKNDARRQKLYSLPRLVGSKLVLKRPFDGSKSALKRLLNGFK